MSLKTKEEQTQYALEQEKTTSVTGTLKPILVVRKRVEKVCVLSDGV